MRHTCTKVILFILILLYCSILFKLFKHSNESWIKTLSFDSMLDNSSNIEPTDQKASLTVEEIKQEILNYNTNQWLLNEDIYGSITNDTVIILIQVHTRLNYLKHLIYSLSQAAYISNTLLIFSHDYFDSEINSLVQSIDFCKVIQIFFPYSQQTRPKEFSADDPIECERNTINEYAANTKCNRTKIYFAPLKHHWWWKANFVFNGLRITKHHNGPVIFLEEDHYMAEDFLHVLSLLQNSTAKFCPHCNVLSLGNYLHFFHYYTYHRKVEIIPWHVTHNMGFSFNRTVWTSIQSCAKYFCNYKDYNWDWSLLYTSNWCLKNKLTTLAIKGPRVFHIGLCGFHHADEDCTSKRLISDVRLVLKQALKSHQLYPTSLMLVKPLPLKKPKRSLYFKGNGLWTSSDDGKLCLNMTLSNR